MNDDRHEFFEKNKKKKYRHVYRKRLPGRKIR
jgi:hypothetical protein